MSDGDETEEIEDLRLIRRNEHFPLPKKKRRTKKSNFSRVRSVQLMLNPVNNNVPMQQTPIDNGGGGENDTDEKGDEEVKLNKSHGSRSFKKPSCSGSRGRDNDSFYTGKSFYDCP